ncbi:MAG: PDZ domain-containing protein [Clostridia bacterium]|nr:PDZ domain-containing protein [Clostridia bacterium]
MSKTKKAAAVFLAALFLSFAVVILPVSAADMTRDDYMTAENQKMLIAAGVPFGVRLHTDGVIIVNLTKVGSGENAGSPARDAGICKGDVIISINGERISSAKALCDIVEKNGGELSVTVKRDGKEKTFSVKSAVGADGKYKIGVLARDNAAGIGTVTFIDPETGVFAGLGHGICDSETGALVPVSYGTCEEVSLTEIIKGKRGEPGELRGFFTGHKTGKILKNSYAGIVGALCGIPEELASSVYPAAGKGKVHSGKAKIIATVDGGGRAEYEINISSVDESGGQKNFTVEITDESLIAKTGGIVQGMSGSPIIQDGYLVGAVTHVMVSDPTKGYGILIENMLSETASSESAPIAA